MEFDLKSWIAGYALGRAGASLSFAPMPGAYLYNGHRLPQLLLWDRAAFPCALILIPDPELPESDGITLYVLSQAPIWENGMVTFGDGIVLRSELSGEGKWSELVETDDICVVGDHIRWTNADLCDAGGTVYLEASNLVPFYGQE